MTRGVWKGPFVHPSLLKKIDKLKSLGINDIILDPGFGFAKDFDQNFDQHFDFRF